MGGRRNRVFRATAIFLILAVYGVNAAHAASEAWDCTYAGFGDSRSKFQVRYQIQGNVLDEVGTANVPSRILENNQIAIIAATGGALPAFMVPEHGLTIGSSIVIIKKDSGELVLGVVSWGSRGPTSETTSGSCHRAKP
jgi:hypothetical protein